MRIRYTAAALEQLERLDVSTQKRIVDKMDFFAMQEKPLSFAKHLIGYRAYRFRIGAYRVFCDVESFEILAVVAIAKRDDAYKDL
ncbi:type II toxin-antitoxin system mRNA interferase toxin, RelE/StbE family [Candidatus Parcubacteria bacterium]|nr:MAG: type II toxin-antitoxin system mRNA interferase toxin, RelE/StbE family [Candidatus Parcubacteria bacterium]